MSIVLNGTTGITTPDLTSADDITANSSAVLTTASSLASANLTGALPAISGAALTDLSGTPTGALLYFAASTAPTGFIKANGASLDTTTYADLFAIVAYTYGGSGASFTLPDLRGEFMRGWDDARGIDSGRAFGSAQGDAIRNITGGVTGSQIRNNVGAAGYGTGAVVMGADRYAYTGAYLETTGTDRWDFDASRVVPTAAENRPRNVALLACIKY